MKTPPHFMSDACLRCGREFRHGEVCLLVFGGPNARYKDIGLVICRDCLQGEQLDKIVFLTVYFRRQRGTTWPKYCGSYGVNGWAKVSRLSNGTYRVGLHRGHVEVWSKESVESVESGWKSGVMGYAKDYGLYGPKALGDFIVHLEEEIQFVDLTRPELLEAEAALPQNLDERKTKELLAHYEDVFGKPPKLEDIKGGRVPQEFFHNLKTLEGMFRSGKVSVSEECPTCQEIVRHGGGVIRASHSLGFTGQGSGNSLLPPRPSKSRSDEPESPVGYYSEALDKQVELADFWSSLAMRQELETAIAKRFAERGSRYQASLVAGMMLPPLLRGETFYWSEPICGLIESASTSIPNTWTLNEEALEVLHAFAWLARPIRIPSSKAPVCAIGWFPVRRQGGHLEEVRPPYERPVLTDPGRDALCLVFFSLSSSFPAPFPGIMAFWPIMAQLRDVQAEVEHESGDLPGPTIQEKASLFATMVAFMQQRILLSHRFLADRAARRRAGKARQSLPSQEVHVVSLRRVAYRGEGRHSDVEWACQWIVRGHWRNQWYPSHKHNRPKWIVSYVKGPKDKPLREPGRVFAVVR